MPEQTAARARLIMHLDMDAFFASVEQRDHPEYRGRPVVVGAKPGGRGVVATCSYEARRYGIRSAMPISEAYRRCPSAIYVRPDKRRYAEASRRVMAVLGEISPQVEQVSVDEAYLDITGLERLFGDARQIGEMTRARVRQAVNLGCSVGIGPNRLIAKLASDYQKPDGLTLVMPDEVQGFLDPMPVANLRGVGNKGIRSILRLGIKTIAQLRACSREELILHFGERFGLSLYRQARGISSSEVGGVQERKSISKEHTFGEDVSDQRLLKEKLRSLASQVARTARREGLKGTTVTLKLRLGGFETHTHQRCSNRPFDDDLTLFNMAWELYRESSYADRPLRLIGVGISHWREEAQDLFGDAGTDAQKRSLCSVMDEVADRFGEDKLSFGIKARD
jgi:DNA polymerase-4